MVRGSAFLIGMALAGIGPLSRTAAAQRPHVSVKVDSVQHIVTVVAGPFTAQPMPAGEPMDMPSPALHFTWPAAGWARGARFDLIDSSGALLPRRMIHHLVIVDFDRRELAYPMVERLIASGAETAPIMLPGSVASPLRPGEHLGLYEGIRSLTGQMVRGVYVRVRMPWVPATAHGLIPAFPFFAEVHHEAGSSTEYDIPPGRSIRSSQFELPVSGGLIAIGGHLHRYARAVWLQDARTGKVLVKLDAKRDRSGHVIGVDRFVFGFYADALHLSAHHPYRIVGEYDNPTGHTIRQGAMAQLAGPFVPDHPRAWPPLDPGNPATRADLQSLSSSSGTANAPAPGSHRR